jgi:hypothetical protein
MVDDEALIMPAQAPHFRQSAQYEVTVQFLKWPVARVCMCDTIFASQKITGAYWFRLKARDTDGMPRKPGWPRYQSWAKHTKANTEELALAA